MKRSGKRIISFSACMISLLCFSHSVSASSSDFSVDEAVIRIPTSCSLSGTGNSSHTTSITNGTSETDIGTTTLKAYCNDSNGFAIYAIGYTDNVEGKNVLAHATLGSSYDIITGTTMSGSTSQWAMKLATNSGATYPVTLENGFSAYHTVPNDYTLVASRAASTDIGSAATGSVITSTYEAFISPTQAAGSYAGQVKYVLVHPSTANSPVVCRPEGTTIATISCMQDISSTNKSSVLSSMTLNQQYTLKDKRDGKSYTIARLADGNIWMTQNLDLDLDNSRTYTNEDTDLGFNPNTGQYESASWTPDNSTRKNKFDFPYDGTINHDESYDPGNVYWSGTIRDKTVANSGIPQYHIGNYYNFLAATAMNELNGVDEFVTIWQSICPAGWKLPGEASDSSLMYESLISAYGFTSSPVNGNDNVWSSPLYLIPSGEIYSGNDIHSINNHYNSLGTIGAYQLPAYLYSYSSAVMHYDLNYTEFFPQASSVSAGFSIRCVVR